MAPTCKNCQHPYQARDVSRVPLMLQCGHTFCSSCLFLLSFKVTKSIQCPSCKAFTPVQHGRSIESQLEVNIYLLGLTVAQELKLVSTPATSSKLHKPILLRSRKLEKSGGGMDKCRECLGAQVEVHCDQCKMSFCKKCFRIVHASANVLRTHTPTPLSQASSASCPRHPDELQRHYCVETNCLMCVQCSLEEERRGHTVISLAQAAEDVRVELKPLLAQAERLYREISRTSQVLHDQVPAFQTTLRSQLEELSLATPTLFSVLQKRVQSLHRQLVETFDLYATPAIQAHGILQEHRIRVHATILRCNEILQDDVKLVQGKSELCKQLSDISSFPARLREGANGTGYLLKGAGEVRRLLLQEGNEAIGSLGERISQQQIEPPSLCAFSGDPYDLPAASPEPPPALEDFIATPPMLAPPPGYQRSKSYSPYRDQGKCRLLNSSSSLSPRRGRNPSPAYTSSSRATPTRFKSPQITPPPGLRDTPQRPTPQLRRPTKVDNLERVVVSFVKNVDEFYVQNCQQEKELKELQEQLWTHCHSSNTQPNPSLLKKGLVCGGFSERYQQWYRVYLDEIISSEEGAALTVIVFYMDYGDTEELPASSLCVLPQKLRGHRPMASCCHLHQLRPSARIPLTPAPHSWSYKATEKLKEYTNGITLNMQVFEEDSPDAIGARMLAVDLIADNQLSIREKLHFDGLAVLSKPATPPQPAVAPHAMALGVGQTVGVVLIAAQTPWNFHVHIEEKKNELEAITAQLKTAFEMDRLPRLDTPTVGAWVTARSVEHEDFFRAKITGVGYAGVTVQYSDYGNEEDVPVDRLYVLPNDIASIEVQAIHCHLSDVAPPEGDKDWAHTISDYFHELLDNALEVLVTVQEEGQPHKVKVQVRVDGVLQDVAMMLVKEGKARWLLPRTTPGDPHTPPSETPEGPCTPPGDPSTSSTPSRSSESSATSPAHISKPQSTSGHHQAAVSGHSSGPQSSSDDCHHAAVPLPNGEHCSAPVTPLLPAINIAPIIPPPLLPAIGERFQCYVTHVDHSVDLGQCFHVVRPLDPPPTRPINGQAVGTIEVGRAAWAEYAGEWYRVVYEGPVGKGEGYKVHYVDSGDRDVAKHLFPLSAELSKIPCKAIPCCLAKTVDPSILCQHQPQELTAEVQSISADGRRVVVMLDKKQRNTL